MDESRPGTSEPLPGGSPGGPGGPGNSGSPGNPGGPGSPGATDAGSKPLGVVLLAFGVAVIGALGLITGISLLALAFSGQITELVTELQPADATAIALALGWAYAIEGGLGLVVAFGLFALKTWAWLFALLLLGWRIVASIFAWLTGSLVFGWAALLVVVAGLLIAYLLSRDVKEAFARNP